MHDPAPPAWPAAGVPGRHVRRIILLLACLAALVRTVDLGRPLDGRIRNGWREADDAAIARNFAREGLDPRYPRIDWRGTGPGYAEMEFPFGPWLLGVAERTVHAGPQAGRLISFTWSVVAGVLMLRLVAALLPAGGVIGAGLFWSVSPLSVSMATALQPESLMLAALVASVLGFWWWLEAGRRRWWAFTLAATAVAILAKLPAAQVGLVFAALLVRRRGWRGLLLPAAWGLALGALLPAAWWYWHAHQLWLVYGNSLGVSNEFHWFGWDLLRRPGILLGIPVLDYEHVWGPGGLALAAWALWRGRWPRALELAAWWLGAAAIFYLGAARSTGREWAAYYHLFSLPAATLLVGAGWASVTSAESGWRRAAGVGAGLVAVGWGALQVRAEAHPRALVPAYEAAQAFQGRIPPGSLVLVSGGPCEVGGTDVAYNASYFFYWLDRKGFNICQEEQSWPALRGLAGRGAGYFVAERSAMRSRPGFEATLRAQLPVLGETPEAVLFDLRGVQPPGTPTRPAV